MDSISENITSENVKVELVGIHNAFIFLSLQTQCEPDFALEQILFFLEMLSLSSFSRLATIVIFARDGSAN